MSRRPHRCRFLLLCLLSGLGLGACGSSPPVTSATASDAPGPGSIQLFLNDPTGRARPVDGCDVDLCRSLVDRIERAQETIDFALYGVRNQSALVGALQTAQARGVRIRGVVDRDVEGNNYYSSTEAMIASLGADNVHDDHEAELEAAEEEARNPRGGGGSAQCERPEGFDGPLQCLTYEIGEECLVAAHASRGEIESEGSIMHNKFFIVDGRYVWTGSTNASDSGTGGYNANLVTLIDSEQVARWYTEEFEQMFEDGRYHRNKRSRPEMRTRVGNTDVELLFSPQDRPITRRVRRLLRDARERIDVAVFFLTHKGIARDLIDAHRRGVRVRVILDATAAGNGYTKHELLRAVGIPVVIERWGGKMHMKSAAIDGEVVIAGSMNWTSAGEGGNDENTLILRDPELAEQYHGFFERIWRWQGDTFLQGRPDPEGPMSTTACTDGVDNDFDHLADADDPGCGESPPPVPPLPPWRVVPMRDGSCNVDDPTILRSGP